MICGYCMCCDAPLAVVAVFGNCSILFCSYCTYHNYTMETFDDA